MNCYKSKETIHSSHNVEHFNSVIYCCKKRFELHLRFFSHKSFSNFASNISTSFNLRMKKEKKEEKEESLAVVDSLTLFLTTGNQHVVNGIGVGSTRSARWFIDRN